MGGARAPPGYATACWANAMPTGFVPRFVVEVRSVQIKQARAV